MIQLLIGDNSFEIERAVAQIATDFDGQPERIDGSELELRQLPDLLMGGTLFATERLVIIKRLSDNKAVWDNLGEWLERVSDDIHLVLIEPKIDKRSALYKRLQRGGAVQEYKAWGERDQHLAEQWARQTAQTMGLTLDAAAARHLVQRVGVDQWAVYRALEKLAIMGTATPAAVEEYIDASPNANVFAVFETALRGDRAGLKRLLDSLALAEDPYRLFGLLSGQVFQLAALAVTTKPAADVARDLGVHPYGLQKLVPQARRLGRAGARRIVRAFAEADDGLKTSVADPWLLIERALYKI